MAGRPRRLALTASVLGVCAAVAVVVLHMHHGPAALLGAESTIAHMLENEPFTGGALAGELANRREGKQLAEIPDPHPDPDPFPYPGHPARSPIRGVAVNALAPHKMTGLTLREKRNGVYASPHMGRMHGCKPEGIILVPGDDCDPLTAKMQPALARWESIRSARNPTLGTPPHPANPRPARRARQ